MENKIKRLEQKQFDKIRKEAVKTPLIAGTILADGTSTLLANKLNEIIDYLNRTHA